MKTITIEAVGPTAGIDEAIENILRLKENKIEKFTFFGDGIYDHEVEIIATVNDKFAAALCDNEHFGLKSLSDRILGTAYEA